MELLQEIKDKEFPSDESNLEIREASRAVLFDEKSLVPLLFVAKYNYHKLPGGGVKVGENRAKALAREVKEEIGSDIEITGEVGKIIEFRSKYNLKQISYCYLGKVISKDSPNFTTKELSEGFKLIWLSLDEAVVKVANDKPENYEGSFILKRDIAFLKKARQIMAQEILLRIVKTWRLSEKPEYRGFKCAYCQKNMRKAWHHWLAKGGYKTPVHFCNKCEADYESSNIKITKSEINIDRNKFGLKFPKKTEAKLREIVKKWNTGIEPQYKIFACDACAIKMRKVFHVWFNMDKIFIEAHFCRQCGDEFGLNNFDKL